MSRFFEFEITKDEAIKLNKLLHSLALLCDFEEVQQANFIWSNIFNRNMFGYSLDFDSVYKRLCRERKFRKNHGYENNK